ncbi:MAG TPA: DNA-binding domain-containing protein [Steroidobacteraceae bacterium]|nr:DNA-binding domain-containing protein [Steroidobacteraceae bacterium]
MRRLRELQEAVIEAVCGDDPGHAASHVTASGLEATARLEVYRNNVQEGFLSALEIGFPVVVRLGGAEWFRQTALAFMQVHPSRSGDLRMVGQQFATYLARLLKGTPYEYFADTARLCWAYQQVLDAPDAPPLELASLAGVAADRYHDLVFEPHPAARVVVSPYPVLRIWQANQPDVAEPPMVHLDAGVSRVLVLRRAAHVELRELSIAEHLLLDGFAGGASLGELVERIWAGHREADVPDALATLAQLGAFAGFRMRNDHGPRKGTHG